MWCLIANNSSQKLRVACCTFEAPISWYSSIPKRLLPINTTIQLSLTAGRETILTGGSTYHMACNQQLIMGA
jgi:hypothetical protein